VKIWHFCLFFFPKIRDMMITRNLRAAFKNAGLIVKEVSSLSGVSKYTIDNWLNKNKEPQASALYLVCKSIQITMEQAIDGEAGVEYVRQWVKKGGKVYTPPDHIADIVQGLVQLDDLELAMIRGAVLAAVDRKKGTDTEETAG
jgi:transcriptional regulator with XRE-family HTH domain